MKSAFRPKVFAAEDVHGMFASSSSSSSGRLTILEERVEGCRLQ